MSYAAIDPAINEWVAKNSLHLFTRFADRDARFIYASSKVGECFQISVDAPAEGRIRVSATAIETKDDDELAKVWKADIRDLAEVLDEALETVHMWMRRHSKGNH
jgi:hypothetical protein